MLAIEPSEDLFAAEFDDRETALVALLAGIDLGGFAFGDRGFDLFSI